MTPATPAPRPRFTGVRLLTTNQEAWQAKRHLIGTARHTLDLAYFILEVDGSTTRLLLDLVAAAQRGVQVRLLVDYFLTFAQAPVLRGLAALPNIQVRRYGPPTTAWLAALAAAGIDRQGFVTGLMATDGAMMARALKGCSVFPPQVAQALGALRAERGQAAAGFAQQVLSAVTPGADAAADAAKPAQPSPVPVGPAAAADRMAALRQVATVIEVIRGLKQFMHRSHHKLLLADGRRFIMGGRNLADAYQCDALPPPARAFIDTDLLARDGQRGGSGHRHTFEQLWADARTLSITQPDPLETRPAQPLAAWQDLALPAPAVMPGAAFRRGLKLPDMNGTLVDNLPADKGDTAITRAYTERIRQFTASGQPGAIDIVNAYVLFVADDLDSTALLAMRQALLDAARAGITVNVYTNSLASTDLRPVNRAAYPKLLGLIEGGVNIFELADGQGSLHAKCAAIGECCLIIGSYNMDPRSELYDTNNLVVFEDQSGSATAVWREAQIASRQWMKLTLGAASELVVASSSLPAERLTSNLL
jgi:phosphatidylserine/phosphatidylglycerophosphate/cardiolipin synthase-like enzyme